MVADLSKEDGCRSLGEAVAERWDSLDILVNNAGANWGVPLAEQDSKSWHRVLDVNVEGVLPRHQVPAAAAAEGGHRPRSRPG